MLVRAPLRKILGGKKDLYASALAVKEYYIYDPLGQIVPSFIGYRLIDGVYQEIDFANERLPSEVLDLELGEHEDKLRLYNPNTSQWLKTPPERVETAEARAETAEARAETAEAHAEIAEAHAQQESTARKIAEAALAEALAELERLQSEKND